MSETPYYKNTRDTLAEVGISARQLAYWRKEGLFTSELGDNKRYTRRDIGQLKFLKKLVDPKEGYGLPVEKIRELLATLPSSESSFWTSPEYIDLEEKRFITPKDVFQKYINDQRGWFFVNEPIASTAVLLLLQAYAYSYSGPNSKPTVYAASRDAFLERLQHIDRLARLCRHRREPTDRELQRYADMNWEEPEYIEYFTLAPALPEDPEFTDAELRELWEERVKLTNESWR